MSEFNLIGVGLSGILSLASVSVAGIVQPALYGVRTYSSDLMSIDMTTGSATVVANLGYGQITGMTYDPDSDTLYGASYSSDLLLAIDPLTGTAEPVAPIGIDWISAMTYDQSSGYLYGVDGLNDTLVRIDPHTGETTTIGSMGYSGVYTLAIDTTTNTMYSVDNSRDKILTVDMNTGQATPFADLDRGVGGLTFDPRSGLLIAAFNFNDGEAGGQQIVTPAHTANITPQNHVLASP